MDGSPGTCFCVFHGRRQRFEATAREDIAEIRDHLIVDAAVGRQYLAAVEAKRCAVEARHFASRFPDDQDARRGIPGVKVELPEAVVTSGSDIGQIKGGGTRSPHTM